MCTMRRTAFLFSSCMVALDAAEPGCRPRALLLCSALVPILEMSACAPNCLLCF